MCLKSALVTSVILLFPLNGAQICTRPSFSYTHIKPYGDQFLTVPLHPQVISGCLDRNYLQNSQDVRSIQISNQTVPVLYEGAVNNLTRLVLLNLDENGIEQVHPGAFNHLTSLQELSLRKNFIKEVKNGVFNYLPISKLYLSKNRIDQIDSAAFDHMPNLAIIVLSNNEIRHWDPNWFNGSPQITNVFVSHNRITKIPTGAFRNIRGRHFFGDQIYLTKLYFNRNDIREIAPGAFDGLDMLDTLDFEGNQLALLETNVFSPLRNVRKIILKNNRLVCLPYDLPEVISDMYDVEYENNPMDPLCVDSFRKRMSQKGYQSK